MSRRRSSANSVAHSATSAAYDSITLHAFMFTLTLATAVVLAYGPAAALYHIADVLATMGDLPLNPGLLQGAMVY